jgi:Fic family protein
MWIYERNNWPNFTWDSNVIASKLSNARFKQGILLGKMENLGFDLKKQASLDILTSDILKTSEIEGEELEADQVRSSVAKHLRIAGYSLSKPNRDVEALVEMILDATQNYATPLTKERLFKWHKILFSGTYNSDGSLNIGSWRDYKKDPMQVISGPYGKEKIHFEAPNAKKVETEMKNFLKWFEGESNDDSIIKSAIAHFWFVTIHPFEDGNGRIARAVTDLALARSENSSERFYSMSTQIEADRDAYYNILEVQQKKDLDITDWLVWFIECFQKAIDNSEEIISRVIYKSKIWNEASKFSLNDRQKSIINRMLDENFIGFMNTSKYAKLAKCSNDTALRDIKELQTYKILIQNEAGGRSTSYRLVEF